MQNTTKGIKERIERLIDLDPYNAIRMELLLDKAIGEVNLMVKDGIPQQKLKKRLKNLYIA